MESRSFERAHLRADFPRAGGRRGSLRYSAGILALLAGCATIEPPAPPEVRTQTVQIRIPVPVPCFTEAERPILAPPTPINIDTATVAQMAAAMAADDLNEQLYTVAVDALFIRCMKGNL